MEQSARELGRQVLDAIRGYVARECGKRDERLDEIYGLIGDLETKLAQVPKVGPPGKDAEPIHPDTVALMVRAEVEKAVALIPKPLNGSPGRDALDIRPLPHIDEAKSYPVGTWATHNGGLWLARSVTDGMAGWECVHEGVAPIAIETNDNRNFMVKFSTSSGKTIELPFSVPSMIYRDVWKSGEYEAGDCVTFGGSLFHCQRTTKDKPETSDAWKLAVKRGRDGK